MTALDEELEFGSPACKGLPTREDFCRSDMQYWHIEINQLEAGEVFEITESKEKDLEEIKWTVKQHLTFPYPSHTNARRPAP